MAENVRIFAEYRRVLPSGTCDLRYYCTDVALNKYPEATRNPSSRTVVRERGTAQKAHATHHNHSFHQGFHHKYRHSRLAKRRSFCHNDIAGSLPYDYFLLELTLGPGLTISHPAKVVQSSWDLIFIDRISIDLVVLFSFVHIFQDCSSFQI